MENGNFFYKLLFKLANILRVIISKLPKTLKYALTSIIATFAYLSLARLARHMNKVKFNVANMPLHHGMNMPFLVMKNDALDRFDTSLEQRFTKIEMKEMLIAANFDVKTLVFSEFELFWTFAVKNSLFNVHLDN
jgi:hypothetical protein